MWATLIQLNLILQRRFQIHDRIKPLYTNSEFNLFMTINKLNELKKMPSILWASRTLKADWEVLLAIADYFVPGNSQKHKTAMAEKMFRTIQTKKWRNQFTSKNFIFCIYYSSQLYPAAPIDITGMLCFQALENLFPQLGGDETVENFNQKIQFVYKNIYDKERDGLPDIALFNNKTGNILRIIRNNIAHNGSMLGNNKYSPTQEKAFAEYIKTHGFEDIKNAIFQTLGAAKYLIGDIVLRVLGLDWENDLSMNGRPPQYLDIFFQKKPRYIVGVTKK